MGLLGVAIILSSMGFSDIHIGRSGDYDALLTLWIFLGSLTTFSFIESKNNKTLFASALFLVLALLTKGIAGLFMFPGVLVYIIMRRKFKALFSQKTFWVTFLISVCIIGCYYVGRNILNPGYLSAVWKEDLLGRFGKAVGAVNHEFFYYWDWLKNFRFQKWIYIVPFSCLSYVLVKKTIYKRMSIYLFLLTVSYFLIISYSETKQIWYDAPLYPIASILVAIFIISFIGKFPLLIRPLLVCILCFYLQRYIRTNIAYIYRPDLEASNSCLKYGYIFREYPSRFRGYVGVDKDEGFCMPFHFYLLKEGLTHKNITEVTYGDKLFTCDSSAVSYSEHTYKTVRTFDKDGCWGIYIVKESN